MEDFLLTPKQKTQAAWHHRTWYLVPVVVDALMQQYSCRTIYGRMRNQANAILSYIYIEDQRNEVSVSNRGWYK